jgi:hypothetical protein
VDSKHKTGEPLKHMLDVVVAGVVLCFCAVPSIWWQAAENE